MTKKPCLRSSKIANLVGVCSLVVGLCSWLWPRTETPQRLAPHNLALQLGVHQIASGEQTEVYLGAPVGGQDAAYCGFFPFILHNVGETTVEDATIVMELKGNNHLKYFQRILTGPLRNIREIKFDSQEVKGSSSSIANLCDGLNPGEAYGFEQLINLVPTERIRSADSPGESTGGMRILRPMKIEVEVTAKDIRSQKYSILVHVVNCTNKDFLRQHAMDMELKKLLVDGNPLSYRERYFTGRSRRIVVAFAPPKLYEKLACGSVYEVRFSPNDFGLVVITIDPIWRDCGPWLVALGVALLSFRLCLAGFRRCRSGSKMH